jgi:DNA-binding response OmpR family regulator
MDHRQTIRLAVIDTDSGFVTVLAKRAETAGWQLRHATGPLPPQELVAMKLSGLVIDPTALDGEAWDYLRRVCDSLPDLCVVVCTERSTVAQRVRALRFGVDDWVAKPCHPEEVIARLEAASRRRPRDGRVQPAIAPIVAGDLEIKPDQFQAFVGGESLDFTRREFELLRQLAEAKTQVLEREEIYRRVWGYAMAHGDRSVDVFVRKLRQKLEKRSPRWHYIHTHFGVGYRFDPEPAGIVEEEIRPAPLDPAPATPAEAPSQDHSSFV